MNNTFNLGFRMYEPSTDFIIANTGENTIFTIRCNEYNFSIIFNDSSDVVYLYRLSKDSPFTYTKLVLKENGLEDCRNAINELN